MKKIELVYIVEDDLITSFVIKKIIDDHSNIQSSVVYTNGQEAFNALEKTDQVPDLILLDINMPVMDGWEFLEAFGNTPKENPIPIFILSSSIDPEDKKRASSYQNEVKGFFSKPFTDKKLEEILNLLNGQ